MKHIVVYLFLLFVGLPMLVFGARVATLSDGEKRDLDEAGRDFHGRIYQARIHCPRSDRAHVMRVHGRSRDEARRKVERQLRNCDVEMLGGASAPIWQEALRKAR